MGATSEHFSEEELRCKCGCGENGMKPEALEMAEEIRKLTEDHYGIGRVRMTVHSGYRCEAHNRKVGGAPRSQHVQGLALDIQTQIKHDRGKGGSEWVPLQAFLAEAVTRRSQKIGGMGRDDARNFLHIDARPRVNGQVVKWCYDAGGKQVTYFPAKQ